MVAGVSHRWLPSESGFPGAGRGRWRRRPRRGRSRRAGRLEQNTMRTLSAVTLVRSASRWFQCLVSTDFASVSSPRRPRVLGHVRLAERGEVLVAREPDRDVSRHRVQVERAAPVVRQGCSVHRSADPGSRPLRASRRRSASTLGRSHFGFVPNARYAVCQAAMCGSPALSGSVAPAAADRYERRETGVHLGHDPAGEALRHDRGDAQPAERLATAPLTRSSVMLPRHPSLAHAHYPERAVAPPAGHRLLFTELEITADDVTPVADLRRSLDIDAGYLSRVLARFEADGLVSRRRSDTDARRQDIELTGAGRAAAAELDTRSASQIGDLLSGVDGPRLLDAMREITGLLGGPAPRTVLLRPPSSGDLGWVVQRHGAVYTEEFGWNQDFEAHVARLAAWATWTSGVTSVPRPGSPRWTARPRARCSAFPRTRRRHGCGCCSWNAGPAASASAPGWSTRCCGSPAGWLPAHRAVHLRRARQRQPDLPGGLLLAGQRGTSAQFRTGTQCSGLGAILIWSMVQDVFARAAAVGRSPSGCKHVKEPPPGRLLRAGEVVQGDGACLKMTGLVDLLDRRGGDTAAARPVAADAGEPDDPGEEARRSRDSEHRQRDDEGDLGRPSTQP